MNPAVELAGLAIGYRNRRRSTTVAAGLDAQARRGELTVLIGPNGAGKSTLIRTLAGLQPALGGRVLLDGADLTGLPRDELARRVAVVLTERIDPGLLSARELVALGRIPHLGLGARLRREDDEIIDWALTAAGARHLASRPAAELSDGECQRVLTARALAQQPGLLVLDEPTAFLDVSSRAGLFGLLRKLARDQQLAVVLSTHDLELALRVADRVWLLDPAGTLADTVGEELMLSGRIGAMFDTDTLRFDASSGMFAFGTGGGARRAARVDAPEPLRAALIRVLSREGWDTGEPAEMVVTATGPDAVTLRSAASATRTTLHDLPQWLRALPATPHRCAPDDRVVSALTELATVSPYFAVSTGAVEGGGWRPVSRLYTAQTLLADVVGNVGDRIGASDLRVAASAFFLGFAARLWSIGLGALAEHGLLLDLDPDELWYAESDGTVRLHLADPVAWQGSGLDSLLADDILSRHLTPLAAAVRRLGPISAKLLHGNAASAVLGAARALHRHRGAQLAAEPCWELARAVCADERLSDTIRFNDSGTDYRRATCCLFYRTPGAGLCVDCALTHKPQVRTDRKRKGST
ncbi:ATP-binding cassette domain-containing protein [Mycolicibacter sinensis]|uniref:ABC transporter n=1 Tax=Mycolicibacter sinensis (strain JDM601) TaxID=875328 RepID=A0A1A2E9L4_MYCSD|nr:ATP-binding cassette domain-containing protein [Mycolicibacter sinensis]OBG01262.1 ABC transporter [Mycolicibacter sinensis]OBG02273.1 ABC transporter [Mycolicibacter sinensis]